MIAALAFALDLAITPVSPVCSNSAAQPLVQQAAKALDHKDFVAAKTAIDPVAACPANSAVTYAAHVLRAEIAVREEDWATARAMLTGVSIHPEASLSARAGLIRLRADQGLNDAPAFAADRAALIDANEKSLLVAGHKIESFRVGAANVTAFDASFDQGSFRRVMEFIVVPDDQAAYPASILLTDDQGAIRLQKALVKSGETAPEHAWFVDLYTCPAQSTLPMAGKMFGPQPSYSEVKAKVVVALADGTVAGIKTPPPRSICGTAPWLLPGLGRH
jgi:hypothetical protein